MFLFVEFGGVQQEMRSVVVVHVGRWGRRGKGWRVMRVVGGCTMWRLVVRVWVQSTSWRIASVVAQPQGPRGVGNTVGGVVKASTRERKSKTGHKRNIGHRLPHFGRTPSFLLHVWFANIVQWVTGVRRMGVIAAKVDSEYCRQ